MKSENIFEFHIKVSISLRLTRNYQIWKLVPSCNLKIALGVIFVLLMFEFEIMKK